MRADSCQAPRMQQLIHYLQWPHYCPHVQDEERRLSEQVQLQVILRIWTRVYLSLKSSCPGWIELVNRGVSLYKAWMKFAWETAIHWWLILSPTSLQKLLSQKDEGGKRWDIYHSCPLCSASLGRPRESGQRGESQPGSYAEQLCLSRDHGDRDGWRWRSKPEVHKVKGGHLPTSPQGSRQPQNQEP